MKWKRALLAALVFVGVSLVLCILCAGLFFLSGGEIKDTFPTVPEQGTEPEPEEPKHTVIIDAGHGGEDGGASSASGLVEKDVNLDISNTLCQMLRASGVNVVMTREEDKLL